ncbi:hypothetical protein BDDG_02427 [Blastomyces dermatitidis ATCC 18188]|uniref:Uncharacterized protein n=1 Tax=Ajellomyces dermatitidis (strain ATCC 18188 / CBS 674.68) TaxID=653446 RepID=F2T8C3_AJEDA|nr:hypothetical protein BDDG_02427 [Blastomyces dermatitidis ATCC 18188]
MEWCSVISFPPTYLTWFIVSQASTSRVVDSGFCAAKSTIPRHNIWPKSFSVLLALISSKIVFGREVLGEDKDPHYYYSLATPAETDAPTSGFPMMENAALNAATQVRTYPLGMEPKAPTATSNTRNWKVQYKSYPTKRSG